MGYPRVCHISSVHKAVDDRIFYREALSLAKSGYSVTIIALHDKDETAMGIKIIALSKIGNRFLRMLWQDLRLFLLALKQRSDIYHFHDPELMPVALMLKIITRAKIIYDVHEDMSKAILSAYWICDILKKFISEIFNRIERLSAKFFDYIIAATPAIAGNFKNIYISVVANYPVLGFFLCYGEKKQKTKNDPFTIIYCGGLTKIRSIKEVILSLGYIRNQSGVKLKLLGDFYDSEFENEVKSLQEWRMVEYSAWVSQDKVIENLYKADCGVVCFWPEPNHVNALPAKMFEYMATGLPVIASNFPLWKDIIEGNKCGICVDHFAPRKIAEAIEYLIINPPQAKAMGDNGKKAVLEKYNWVNEEKKLLQAYGEVLKRGRLSEQA